VGEEGMVTEIDEEAMPHNNSDISDNDNEDD